MGTLPNPDNIAALVLPVEEPLVGGGDDQEYSEKGATRSKVRVVEDSSSYDKTKQRLPPSPPFLLSDGLVPLLSKLIASGI